MRYALAFQRRTFNYPDAAARLIQTFGTAEEVYAHRADIRNVMPDASDTLCGILNSDWEADLRWADTELEWCRKKNIRVLTPDNKDYPQRLLNCHDMPVVLYYRGTADLNAEHIISIVGTRQSTSYGHDVIKRMTERLRGLMDNVLVVSGLAYGIDIASHRSALEVGFDTIGVVAHGLDTLYPAAHRGTAIEMLSHGGILTEYPSKTRVDRQNFLRRNRIVAGMSDMTIVVESKSHGGSLVTARLANDYGREVMAVPGRVHDDTSVGCNELIRDNKAHTYTSPQDIIDILGWHTKKERAERTGGGIVRDLFPQLSHDEQLIVSALEAGDLHINELTMKTQIQIGTLSALLFQMEMSGIVRPLAGNLYHLVK